jgi:hypothetical protein
MVKRKIIVFSGLTGVKKQHETEATHWGELKAELGELAQGNIEAVIKGTNNTLNMDKAILPATEFTLFIVATKMKSGIRLKKEDAFTNLKKKELKKVCKHLNLGTTGDEKALLRRLRDKQRRIKAEYTPAEVADILAPKKKATPNKEVEKVEEVVAADPVNTEAPVEVEAEIAAAKEEISVLMEEMREGVLSVVDRIKTTITVEKRIDIFEGLDKEWQDIQDEVNRR